ncbi:MAG: hypothetical protein ACW98Y_03920 [Candidatus Thorarchaeota archaeon]|jgi:hypothetical protein
MSHIYSYTQERFSSTEDPKDRAADVRVRRGVTNSLLTPPRIKAIFRLDRDVTVPLSYIIISRVKEWLKKK